MPRARTGGSVVAGGAPARSLAGRDAAASAAPGQVAIDSLQLTLPVRDAAAGGRIAKRVAERLADRLPPDLSGRFERLELRVHPERTDEDSITNAIVQALLNALPRS